MKIQKKTKKSFLPVIITSVAVLLIAGGISAYFLILNNNRGLTDTDSSSSINYDSPTKQELDSSQDGKKQSAQNEPKDNEDGPQNSTKESANVGISFADTYKNNLEIRAFVNNVIEGDGTCTATATNGSDVINKQSEAFVDASSSQCRPIYIPVSSLKPGVWTVIVKFSSPDAEGTSDKVEVTIK